MYSFTPAVSGNPGILSEQKSTNAWFACATTGVVGQSVSSRSNVMTSTPDDDDDVADAATRADARRDDERATARRARRGHDVAAARATPRAAAKDVDIPDVGRERALERVDDDDDDVDRLLSATTGRTTKTRIPTPSAMTRGVAPASGIVPRALRASSSSASRRATSTRARDVVVATASSDASRTFLRSRRRVGHHHHHRRHHGSRVVVVVAAAVDASPRAMPRRRAAARTPTVSSRAVVASASTAAADANAPLFPHLDLDFRARVSPAELARCVAAAAVVTAVCALASTRHPLARALLATTPRAVRVAWALATFVVALFVARWLALEAKEQARLVAAEDAADEDSAFAAVDGVGIVHYKLRAPNNDAKDENDASSRDVATVVSCVHGFGANAYSFERATAAPLADALNAVVVAHDSPGFGLTERPRDLRAYTPRANAKVCRAMLRLAEAKAEDATGSRTPLRRVHILHWSPYDRVGVVNADP